MKWTKKQKKHFDSILWLFDDKNRQEGRSTVLAWVYIALAMEGNEVNVIDHLYITHSNRLANRYLMDIILSIISEDNLPLEIETNKRMGEIILKRNDKDV